jgi:hypothetical protein
MPNISRSLTISTTKETTKRKQLLGVIKKKRIALKQLILKNEMLRVNLDMARQEYMVKVGSLFLKDNTLDLEIIRLRNILHLMEQGISYNDAVEELSQTYYAEQLQFEKEKEKIRFEEEIFMKREEHKPLITSDLKKLWKRLIAKFHPDLTQNLTEKNKRNTIMKQINKAYEEGDYDQLLRIEKEHAATRETSIESLEEILLTLMKDIDEQVQMYHELKQSEWHDWMIKIDYAKRRDKDIFADTERRLLDDIVAKFDVIKSLKNEIQSKERGLLVF